MCLRWISFINRNQWARYIPTWLRGTISHYKAVSETDRAFGCPCIYHEVYSEIPNSRSYNGSCNHEVWCRIWKNRGQSNFSRSAATRVHFSANCLICWGKWGLECVIMLYFHTKSWFNNLLSVSHHAVAWLFLVISWMRNNYFNK